jgi:hypothetical protein
VGSVVRSKLARFTNEVVTLTQKAVVGNAKPGFQRSDDGYADWVIVSIHSLKMYLNPPDGVRRWLLTGPYCGKGTGTGM